MQRVFDVCFSFLAILILSPLLLPIAAILRLTGEGEVFYVQARIGLNGEKFGLYKFATMLKNSPNIGSGDITVKNDPRVLPIGRFLRKTKINELPQLLNVIKGQMSIVGPRPLTQKNFEYYKPEDQQIISKVLPGLTGVGSIFFRDEEKYLSGQENPMAFYQQHISPFKAELEKWYVRNSSIVLYFTVILLTIWVVIFPSSNLPNKVLKTLPKRPEFLT